MFGSFSVFIIMQTIVLLDFSANSLRFGYIQDLTKRSLEDII